MIIVGALPLAFAGAVRALGRTPEETPRDSVPAAAFLTDAPVAVISAGDLRVTLALPDASRGFYRNTRFDWSGMITGVSRGDTRFYGLRFDRIAANLHDLVHTPAGVHVGTRTAAVGPAEEFTNRDVETVPGFNAAPAAGTFIKIGVGRLRKGESLPYDLLRFILSSMAGAGRRGGASTESRSDSTSPRPATAAPTNTRRPFPSRRTAG